MKVTSQVFRHSYSNRPASEEAPPAENIIATGTGISIRHKGASTDVIQKNDPDDPIVAKKILDSLDLGLVNFDQRERDGIAAILSGRARKVIESRNQAE